jgi:aquaporin Z
MTIESEDLKKYLAEMFGTLALVLVGCGSAVIAGQYIGFLGISFAFGLTVLVMVYTIGHISGCHINPAITIAMLISGKIKSRDAWFYVVFQCFGAIIGAGILLAIALGLPGYSIAENGLGQNGYADYSPGGYALLACFIAEVVLTALFLFVIFGSTSKKAPEGFAGVSIGFSLAIIHIVAIPITGTSVNPARSLGPALLVGGEALGQLWLFWVAPIIGGLLAAFGWKYILDQD